MAALVDARVLSCEAGRKKPDPVLFATIARQLGVAPDACLYVGDGGGRELSGASACGMHAVMLRAADWYTSAAHAREDDWAGPWVPSLSAVLPCWTRRLRSQLTARRRAAAEQASLAPPILRLVPTMPAVPRRGRPPRHNRSQILDAASEVMIFRGYGATRYSDVAEASGVPVASLQHHFPTLAVLRREALRNKVRAELAFLSEKVSVIADPWERVRHIIVTSVSLDPARRRGGWVLWLEYYRAAAHDQALAEDSREVRTRWLSLIADCISDGMRTGQFHPDGTVADAAVELHGLLDGLGIRLAIEHEDAGAAEAILLLERSARRMLRVS